MGRSVMVPPDAEQEAVYRKCTLCDCTKWEPDDDIFCRNCDHEEHEHGEPDFVTSGGDNVNMDNDTRISQALWEYLEWYLEGEELEAAHDRLIHLITEASQPVFDIEGVAV